MSTWTYASEELLELEYSEFFLKSWQMVGLGSVCNPSISSKVAARLMAV